MPTPGKRPSRRQALAVTLGVAGLAALAFGYSAYTFVVPVSARADGPIVRAAARATGLLAEVTVHEGDRVTAGQVVARVAPDDARAALLQAEAEVAEAHAKLAASRANVSVQSSRTTLDRTQAEAETAAARAELDTAHAAVGYARTELTRMAGLGRQGFVSPQEVDKARLAVATARANVLVAEAHVRRAVGQQAHVQAGTAMETVKASEVQADMAEVREAEAKVTLAKLRLSQLEIRAPLAGLVVRRLLEPGEPVAPGETVVAIVDPARLWVDADADEAQAPRLREGLAATVRFEALPGKTFTGHVTYVAGATNDAAPPTLTRTLATAEPLGLPVRVPVRIKLDQPDPALRPGMSAYVRIAVR